MGTELKPDSIDLPTDLVSKYTRAPREEDERQSLEVLQALSTKASTLAGAVKAPVDPTERKREETRRESEERLSAELAAAQQLQRISVELIHEQDVQCLYTKLVDAAVVIMRSDCASMQMLHPEHGDKGELRLLAARGFRPQATKFWERVRADSGCTCGMALRTRERAIATDVETCDFMAGTQDRAAYLQAGIHAVQSTPLLSRSGRLLGMLSTHWREPHEPSETELQRFDVLARQAADLVERAQAETVLRESEQRFRALVDASAQIVWTANVSGEIEDDSPSWRAITGQTFEECKGFGWLDAFHPDDREHVNALWQKAVAEKTPMDTECRLCHTSVGWRWTAMRAVPLLNNGAVSGWVGMNTDITRREEAERSAQQLAAIVESSNDAIVSKDLHGIINSWNPGAERLFGYTAEEAIGRSVTILIPLERHDEERVILEQLRRGERVDHYETIRRRKDGSLTEISLSVSPIRDSNGKIIGGSKIARDISDRRRAEEELRESEARFRVLADNISQLAWTCDLFGNVTWYNKRWLDYTGLTFEDMKGWNWSKVQHPDHLDRVVARVKRSAETGEPWEDTFPLRGKDGEYRWFLSRAMPIRDEEGNILQWFGTNTDVTEQKQAQEALRASEERFRRLLDSAPAGIFVCDRSGVIQAYNARAAEMWGRRPVSGDPNETYCGSVRRRLPSGEVAPHAQGVTAGVLRTGLARENVEVIIERPDGSQISVLVSCAPLTSAQGEVTGAITSFVDITERKRAEEQQGVLLREMNHRIKNLFALASGVVTLSARSAKTPKDLAKAVQERLVALARAHELMLPGLAAGREKANQPATLAALVRAVICPHVAEEDARVAINGPDVPISGAAVTSLALLLHEFATNAAKYGALASETGRIEISWCERKGQLLLAWREQGGPPIDGPPESEDEGFGSTLARLTVTGQLGGKISRDWNKEGLTVNLSVPLDHVAM